MSDSYNNPFSGINASTLDEQAILDYWCSPFGYELFSGIKEEDIYQEKTNIVFMGGRGTGKSMFLKFCGYLVQSFDSKRKDIKFAEIINDKKGIGFYIRIDGPVLRSFQGYDLGEGHWASLFIHYYEMFVGRQFAEVIKLLEDEGSISVEKNVIDSIRSLLNFPEVSTITEIILEFDKRISYINDFRGAVAFYEKPFIPDGRIFTPKSVSFGLAKLIIDKIPFFKDVNFVFLLDEYENFLEYQQKAINSVLKFTEHNIKFRIGMRLEGFRTFKVIDKDDFIKEGREYRKVVFEDIITTGNGYQKFLVDVAKKRLDAIPILKENEFTDITKILTQREDLEQEAIEIVKTNPNLIYETFAKKDISAKDLDKVRNLENPLLELMNFIWLSRGVTPDNTRQAMNDYLGKKDSELAKKYNNDYVQKYKLSLVFLLCRIYRTNKKYYSFNTFAFLSSGIVGHFIELCRNSFAVAGWGNDNALLQSGVISKDDQNTAAIEVSRVEKRQIHRIEDYGGKLSVFVENIGNIFREYHRDFGMTYPETNQFAINIDSIENSELQNTMRSAIKWSVIQKKPKLQRSAPSESLQELYTLNRVFSPIFQISYRTRGGKSVSLDENQVAELVSTKLSNYTNYIPKSLSPKKDLQDSIPGLFDQYE